MRTAAGRIFFLREIVATILIWWMILGSIAGAQNTVTHNQPLDIRWSVPIPALDPPAPTTSAIGYRWITDAALTRNGQLILLGLDLRGAPVLLIGKNNSAPVPIARPTLRGHVYRLIITSDGDVWLGGDANRSMSIASYVSSDAYLARITDAGKLLFDRNYRSGRFRVIWAMRLLSSGELVLVSRDGEATWLAKVTAKGDVAWDRRFGAGKGASIAVLPGDRIVVAAFEPIGPRTERAYRDDVVARVFSAAGEQLAETRIREGLNKMASAYVGKIVAAASGDAVYVVSNWMDPSAPQPIEVAKVSAEGVLLWRTALPDTVAINPGTAVRTSRVCEPSLITLPGGDALIACTINNRIDLYRLNQQSGEATRASASLPECHGGRPARLFPFSKDDGSLWLLGTRPASNVAASCTWLGRVVPNAP